MKTDNRPPVTPVNVSMSEQVFKRPKYTDFAVCVTLKQQQLTFNDERLKHEMCITCG